MRWRVRSLGSRFGVRRLTSNDCMEGEMDGLLQMDLRIWDT
jgi:hypothetical protein